MDMLKTKQVEVGDKIIMKYIGHHQLANHGFHNNIALVKEIIYREPFLMMKIKIIEGPNIDVEGSWKVDENWSFEFYDEWDK